MKNPDEKLIVERSFVIDNRIVSVSIATNIVFLFLVTA